MNNGDRLPRHHVHGEGGVQGDGKAEGEFMEKVKEGLLMLDDNDEDDEWIWSDGGSNV